jgi:hypothetical protein
MLIAALGDTCGSPRIGDFFDGLGSCRFVHQFVGRDRVREASHDAIRQRRRQKAQSNDAN